LSNDCRFSQLVAIFVNSKEDLAAFKDATAADFVKSDKKAAVPKTKKDGAHQVDKVSIKQDDLDQEEQLPSKRQDGGRFSASPLARSLAKSKAIDLSVINIIIINV
jgi:pyruvate/2-oxoglutarate dehydrogenase complex dihydrolipoamide acyltransferase (E2) component